MKSTWIKLKTTKNLFLREDLNKEMEQYFATIFEDVRHERSLILLLILVEPEI